MRWKWSERSVIAAALVLCAGLFAIGWMTRDDNREEPYLQISGGGFIFNYRNAEAYYGFTADVVRPVENGAVLEAEFEDPASGKPIVISERLSSMTNRYALRTPRLHGIEAAKPYKVGIRLYDRERKQVIWETERSYASQLSDDIVPDHALTVGPGYHRPEGLPGAAEP